MVRLDLSRDTDVQLLHAMISNPNCVYVHFAPPCGTSSRARLIQRNADDPLPCRSDACPDGLPNLPQALQSRVQAANQLYQVTAAALVFACGLGKFVSCENPHNSFMWQTSSWKDALCDLPLRRSVFDHMPVWWLSPEENSLAT